VKTRTFKYIKWILSLIAISIIIGISGFAFYLETSIDKIMSKDKQNKLMVAINSSPELPDSFYRTFNKYHPKTFEQGVWGSIINQLLGKRRNQCQCREIYIHPGYTDHWIEFTQPIVALEIEKHCSSKKCFEYNMSVSDFGMNIKGIQEASRKYYNKEIKNLSEKEILELTVIHIAPATYNPLMHRETLDKEVNKIINKN
jgi:hypothetical protein